MEAHLKSLFSRPLASYQFWTEISLHWQLCVVQLQKKFEFRIKLGEKEKTLRQKFNFLRKLWVFQENLKFSKGISFFPGNPRFSSEKWSNMDRRPNSRVTPRTPRLSQLLLTCLSTRKFASVKRGDQFVLNSAEESFSWCTWNRAHFARYRSRYVLM